MIFEDRRTCSFRLAVHQQYNRHSDSTFYSPILTLRPLNGQQDMILSRLRDEFKDKLIAEIWALFAKCSQDAANCEVIDLVLQEKICMLTT